MKTRLLPLLALPVFLAGCGHTEFEWQQKLREIDALNSRVTRSSGDQRRFEEEQAKAQEEIAQLKTMLSATQRQERAAELRAGNERAQLELKMAEQMRSKIDGLRKRLSADGSNGVSVLVRRGKLTVLVLSVGLFEGKSVSVAPFGKKTLKVIADAIMQDESLRGRSFVVVGHTDDSDSREENNAQRSLQRASAVRDFMVSKQGGGLDAGRWSAAGRGSLDPLSTDDSPEAKARNQRIEITLEPEPIELPDYARSVP